MPGGIPSPPVRPDSARLLSEGSVHLFENHDEAYYVWKRAGVRDRVLVHVDAHHDMWWTDDSSVCISDYICVALKHDFLREVVWVVPDATWTSRRGRRAVDLHLGRLLHQYPHAHLVSTAATQRVASLMGRRLTICSLPSLPSFAEPVLLDIDVDFLAIPRTAFGPEFAHGRLPWCWPQTLIDRLHATDLHTDLATIAYSVEGGYTPLRWRFMGDEIAARLRRAEGPLLQAVTALRAAEEAASKGDTNTAQLRCIEAVELLPDNAAPLYCLSHILLDCGRTAEAESLHRRVLVLDPVYRCTFNSAALQCECDGRYADAQAAHRRILALDPGNPYPHLGLGALAKRAHRWREAETWFRAAIERRPDLLEAHDWLGQVLERQHKLSDAARAYSTYLKLAISGATPTLRPIRTHPLYDVISAPGQWRVYSRLARVHERLGQRAIARSEYLMSLSGGRERVRIRFRLAWLFLRSKEYRQALSHARRGFADLPAVAAGVFGKIAAEVRHLGSLFTGERS